MSKYTTEVRYICEYYNDLAESAGYDDVDDIISNARDDIFDSFPIYDEAYRPVLESKILKHYYTREICAETIGLWKLWLNTRMNEIMPYYNKLYESALLKFNPLYDVDVSRTHIRNENSNNENESHTGSTATGSTSGNTSSTDKYSDTPQGGLGGFSNVENNLYLTNARIVGENRSDDSTNVESSDGHSKGKNVTTEDYIERVRGKQGTNTYSSLLKEYRSTLLNIDKMIIDELADLFFGIW